MPLTAGIASKYLIIPYSPLSFDSSYRHLVFDSQSVRDVLDPHTPVVHIGADVAQVNVQCGCGARGGGGCGHPQDTITNTLT